MYFEAYPLIFEDMYGMSSGIGGLAFLPSKSIHNALSFSYSQRSLLEASSNSKLVAVGACVGLSIFLWWDSYLHKAKARKADWFAIEEYQRLPLACLGGPLYVLALFWLGWTASPNIHWIVPMLAGIPFGAGFFLIFVALINYLLDAYHKYAASAMAAASCCRSAFGAILPLAAGPMFHKLGVAWGCSLLGFLSLLMALIPFFFIRYGDKIRARSSFRQHL